MYLAAKTDEERAFYDWFGFVGNLIGVGAFVSPSFRRYLWLRAMRLRRVHLSLYDGGPALHVSRCKGRWSGYLLASNYYILLSMKRIEGLEQIRMRLRRWSAWRASPSVHADLEGIPIPDKFALILPAGWIALF